MAVGTGLRDELAQLRDALLAAKGALCTVSPWVPTQSTLRDRGSFAWSRSRRCSCPSPPTRLLASMRSRGEAVRLHQHMSCTTKRPPQSSLRSQTDWIFRACSTSGEGLVDRVRKGLGPCVKSTACEGW